MQLLNEAFKRVLKFSGCVLIKQNKLILLPENLKYRLCLKMLIRLYLLNIN